MIPDRQLRQCSDSDTDSIHGRAPNMHEYVHHFFYGSASSHLSRALTIGSNEKNSSDLERGAAPRSIADEVSKTIILVSQIWDRHLFYFSQRRCTFREPDCHLEVKINPFSQLWYSYRGVRCHV